MRGKHGLSNTRLHRIWREMQTRCFNEKDKLYPLWGGRGITVCEEWLGKNGFINFYTWAMENGYSEALTIDLVDNDGNYEPSNCRWVDRYTQANNKRNNVFLTYKGQTKTCAQWARELGLCVGTVNNRLHKGWSVEECLFGRKETMHKISDLAVRAKIKAINHNKEDCCNLRKG